MANQFLSLSLFIMLLSFFIVLNAFSSFEISKTREVMSSISFTFTKNIVESEMTTVLQALPEEIFHEGNALDKLEAVFTAQITGVKPKKNRLGSVMHVRIPMQDFDRELSAAARGDNESFGGDFALLLASVLQTADSVPYRMDIILNIGQNPARAFKADPEAVRGHVSQAASYAKRIEDAGLPRKYVSSGLSDGTAGAVDLYFRRYEAFNPLPKKDEDS